MPSNKLAECVVCHSKNTYNSSKDSQLCAACEKKSVSVKLKVKTKKK